MTDFPTSDSVQARSFANDVAADLSLPWYLVTVDRDLIFLNRTLHEAESSQSFELTDETRTGIVIIISAIVRSQIRRITFFDDVRIESCAILAGYLLSTLEDDSDGSALRFMTEIVCATVAHRVRRSLLTSALMFVPNLYLRSNVKDYNLFRFLAFQEIVHLGNLVVMSRSQYNQNKFCDEVVSGIAEGVGIRKIINQIVLVLSTETN